MYRLIIVDDEESIRNGLKSNFPWSNIGYQVKGTFENGLAALNYIKTNEVDVVLCDIKMPIMDGLELAEYVSNKFPQIKIIFLSGHKEFEYAKKALEYGVKQYIVKPTKFDELILTFSKLKDELDSTNKNYDLKNTEDCYYQNIINKVNNYIDDNFATATLEDAANIVHMNVQYLSKLYCQITGENFSSYLIRARMEKAGELLSNSTYKAYEISEMVGYKNPKNFTRTFKRYFGITPREFRLKGMRK